MITFVAKCGIYATAIAGVVAIVGVAAHIVALNVLKSKQ